MTIPSIPSQGFKTGRPTGQSEPPHDNGAGGEEVFERPDIRHGFIGDEGADTLGKRAGKPHEWAGIGGDAEFGEARKVLLRDKRHVGDLHCGSAAGILADNFGGIESLAHRRIAGGVQLGIKTELSTAAKCCHEII